MSYDPKPKELIDALQLKEEGQFKEALQRVINLEENKDLTVDDQITSMLLKSTILNRLGQFEDALKLAEKVYQECERLEKHLQSIDASIEIAESLMYLGRLNKSLGIISNSEDMLNMYLQNIDPYFLKDFELSKGPMLTHLKASIAFTRGLVYAEKGDLDRGIKCTERSLKLRNELGNTQEVARSLTQMGFIFFLIGKYDSALKYLEESLKLEEGNFNRNILVTFTCIGHVNLMRGNLDRALEYYQQSFKLAKEMNAKDVIAWNLLSFGIVCNEQGNLDRALEYFKRSLAIYDEISHNFMISAVLDSLIHLFFDRNAIEQARYYLDRLKQLKDRDNSKYIEGNYLKNKALMLKKTLRAHDRVEAEAILKQVVGEEFMDHEIKIGSLLSLCDLFLIELRNSSDLKILDELQPYITQLLDISEQQGSYRLLAETYLLQSKLSLLTLDIKKARRFLTQAQQIAERFGLNLLYTKISNERDKLLEQLSVWEKLKESNSTLTERIELAQLGEQMENMLRERAALTAIISEEKVTIHKERKICLVCKGEALGFTYICQCDAIYCDNCARALIDLENVCWVCNAPIDKSKPVKSYEKDEEEIGLEISRKKDKNQKKR